MEDWFETDNIDEDTYVICENKHPEETRCYLVCGKERNLLIDTGLGIGNIGSVVNNITNGCDKPIAAVATHIHWDHIGGHKYFSDFYVHSAEVEWVSGKFPLSIDFIKKMLSKDCKLPDWFDLDGYSIFEGTPSRVLKDHDVIDLGNRRIEVFHTPGHSPGHMCFWEEERGYLFSGDLAYKGTLFANYPSTDPKAYLSSLERIAELHIKRLLPAHHSLDIRPEIIFGMRDGLKSISESGKLRHGGGMFDFGDWAILL